MSNYQRGPSRTIPFDRRDIFYPVHKGDKPLRKEEIKQIFAELHRMREEFLAGLVAWGEALRDRQ